MLVLLPPSEGKTPPATGPPVDLDSLSHPELAEPRRRIGDTLARISGQRNAMTVLDVGASLADEVALNTAVWANPTAPAAQVYTGVLYDAARMSTWDEATMARAADRVRIVSALWGTVSPADAIPAYRLSMSVALPRLGGLASWWRPRLSQPMAKLADGGLVVDCRSASYAAAWKPVGNPWVTVSVLRELDGKRAVVSHMAKHTRGLLTAHLMAADAVPESASELAEVASGMIGTDLVDVSLTTQATGPDQLTLVVRNPAPTRS